jgi:hypothetical protein
VTNPFAANGAGLIVDASKNTDNVSAGADAVSKVVNETSQLAEVAVGVRDHLNPGYELLANKLSLNGVTDGAATITWAFNDGKP